jgi:hypothetical protein
MTAKNSREEYTLKLDTKTPCCGIPVTIKESPALQAKQCPRCRIWWRVDVALIAPMHRLGWTEVGKR